jgi:hypothetical protein
MHSKVPRTFDGHNLVEISRADLLERLLRQRREKRGVVYQALDAAERFLGGPYHASHRFGVDDVADDADGLASGLSDGVDRGIRGHNIGYGDAAAFRRDCLGIDGADALRGASHNHAASR